MENMMKNWDKLTEKEKQEFLSSMTEDQRTRFFTKKKEYEQQQILMKKKMNNFDNMTSE